MRVDITNKPLVATCLDHNNETASGPEQQGVTWQCAVLKNRQHATGD